jgi:hypothetical protein
MPGDGRIIFADLIGKVDLLRVACDKCGAVSQIFQYDATTLHNRRGLIEGVESVNAECDPTYPELDRK